MRRADRLFEIIQILRQSSGPMTADFIAATLETGKRTIYRDIATLIAQRVPIRGEAGIGYVLEAGFDLPPLMLKIDEVEAITLGAQWVIAHADSDMVGAALAVLAKISAIVPEDMRSLIDAPAVGTPPRQRAEQPGFDYSRLRQWSREGRKVSLIYRDGAGAETHRLIWPFMVGYLTTLRVVIAWCETRADFRIFRTDRIVDLEFLDMHYPERSIVLRRKWLLGRADASRPLGSQHAIQFDLAVADEISLLTLILRVADDRTPFAVPTLLVAGFRRPYSPATRSEPASDRGGAAKRQSVQDASIAGTLRTTWRRSMCAIMSASGNMPVKGFCECHNPVDNARRLIRDLSIADR